ncbi:hypothetical protein J23TS9_32570 [Paenibacillus sp. J23TS9]|nr:hypothetical protein J23TS9_32570 [Paenibacillus sp. J23TS9]
MIKPCFSDHHLLELISRYYEIDSVREDYTRLQKITDKILQINVEISDLFSSISEMEKQQKAWKRFDRNRLQAFLYPTEI